MERGCDDTLNGNSCFEQLTAAPKLPVANERARGGYLGWFRPIARQILTRTLDGPKNFGPKLISHVVDFDFVDPQIAISKVELELSLVYGMA